MSNGLKVGVLLVVAGFMAYVGYRALSNHEEEISSHTIESAVNDTNAGETSEPKKASETRAKTSLKFDKTEHDFGKIKQGESVECVFKVTNTGMEPLIIEEAHGSCGCTVPDYPKDAIASGETKDIKVKFNSAGKQGQNTKTVTITANTEPLQTVISIKADVQVPEDKK
jgi:hypothetical protein